MFIQNHVQSRTPVQLYNPFIQQDPRHQHSTPQIMNQSKVRVQWQQGVNPLSRINTISCPNPNKGFLDKSRETIKQYIDIRDNQYSSRMVCLSYNQKTTQQNSQVSNFSQHKHQNLHVESLRTVSKNTFFQQNDQQRTNQSWRPQQKIDQFSQLNQFLQPTSINNNVPYQKVEEVKQKTFQAADISYFTPISRASIQEEASKQQKKQQKSLNNTKRSDQEMNPEVQAIIENFKQQLLLKKQQQLLVQQKNDVKTTSVDFYHVRSQSIEGLTQYSSPSNQELKEIQPSKSQNSIASQKKINRPKSPILLVDQIDTQALISGFPQQTYDELSLSQTIFDMNSEVRKPLTESNFQDQDTKQSRSCHQIQPQKVNYLAQARNSLEIRPTLLARSNRQSITDLASKHVELEVQEIRRQNLITFNLNTEGNQIKPDQDDQFSTVSDSNVQDFREQQDSKFSKITEILKNNLDNVQTSRSNILMNDNNHGEKDDNSMSETQFNQQKSRNYEKTPPITNRKSLTINQQPLQSINYNIIPLLSDKKKEVQKAAAVLVSQDGLQQQEKQVMIGNIDSLSSQIVQKILKQLQNNKAIEPLQQQCSPKRILSPIIQNENVQPHHHTKISMLLEQIQNQKGIIDDVTKSSSHKDQNLDHSNSEKSIITKKYLTCQSQTLSIQIRPNQVSPITPSHPNQQTDIQKSNQMSDLDKQFQDELFFNENKNILLHSFNQHSKASEAHSEFTNNMNQELFIQLMSDKFFQQSNQKEKNFSNDPKEIQYFTMDMEKSGNQTLSLDQKIKKIQNFSQKQSNDGFIQRVSKDIDSRNQKNFNKTLDKRESEKAKILEIQQYVQQRESIIKKRPQNNMLAHQRLYQDASKRKEQQRSKTQNKKEKDELLANIMSDRRIMGNLEKYVEYQKKQDKCDIGGLIDQIVNNQQRYARKQLIN